MAAVRGLCSTSSFASTSQADPCSSSSSWGNVLHINAKVAVRRPSSRKCRLVLFAVLVDTQVKSKSSLKLEKSDTERADSPLLELVPSTNFETELRDAASPASKVLAKSKSSLKLEKSDTERADSLLLELVLSTNFETELRDAASPDSLLLELVSSTNSETELRNASPDTERADSLLLGLVQSTNSETELRNASPVSKLLPKKKAPVLGLTDTELKSTLEHRLWVTFGATAVTAMVTKAISACHSNSDVFQLGVGVFAAWVFSDLGTGFYHWGVDNYGDATTPFFGSQIDAFQGHHQRPWTITKREFANNVHAIARPAGFFLCPFLLLPNHPFGDSFLGLFLAMVVLSQHFHALSHMKKSQLPSYIVTLQDAGVILGRKMHGTHHRPPYDVNYCIGSGLWNPVLNEAGIFKRMERVIYSKWGVAPRAWSETSDEWLQSDTYFEDGTEFDPSQSL